MSRDALIVGINQYPDLEELKKPASDAEAIAQMLAQYGEFDTIKRLPEKNGAIDPDRLVTVEELEEAIATLFNPEGARKPDTALLFFAGHGLRKSRGGVTEGFLATSDADNTTVWGVRLKWLRELLQKSPVRQQIIWLDCCHAGELHNFEEADPGHLDKGRSRCFIAACRPFESAYSEVRGDRGVLTGALLQGLESLRESDGRVTNSTLTAYINQTIKGQTQRPQPYNSGDAIIIIPSGRKQKSFNPNSTDCPYKGLEYFTQKDAKYFFGRTALTDQLIEKVRTGNFFAVLGASGSGKSSAIRAGLLYQLKMGEKVSDSDRWHIYEPFTPGEHPIASLEKAIGTTADRLEQLILEDPAPRVVLVADQFEECFALCEDVSEQQKFINCLLDAVERSGKKFCLILAMRSDFFGKCTEPEYARLGIKISEENLVTVTQMLPEELREAIAQPAEKVHLGIESGLVEQIIKDVQGLQSSLPLLQYALAELWKERDKTLNLLRRHTYDDLGQVAGTLEKRANEVFKNELSESEQQVANRIFIELIQLGADSDSDTRRRVQKTDLLALHASAAEAIDKLEKAKLIITREDGAVEIVHEALIRNWSALRDWVNKNRVALMKLRPIEEAAKEWEAKGKPEDLLLQGAKLAEAESFLQTYADTVPLLSLAPDFIRASQGERDRRIKEKEERRQRELRLARRTTAGAIAAAFIVSAVAIFANIQRQEAEKQATIAKLQSDAALANNLLSFQPLEGLLLAIKTTGESQAKFQQVLVPIQTSLLNAVEKAREQNVIQYESELKAIAISPDSQFIVSGGSDNNLRMWNFKGEPIGEPFLGHEETVNSVAISSDSQLIVSGSQDGTVRLWDTQGQLIDTFRKDTDGVASVAISPDDGLIASVSEDGKFRLWNREGKSMSSFQPDIKSSFQSDLRTLMLVSFSPDGQFIISGGSDDTAAVKIWNLQGKLIRQFLEKLPEIFTKSVAFSPDGEYILIINKTEAEYMIGEALVISLEGKDPKKHPGSKGFDESAAFSPDGRDVAIGNSNGDVWVWQWNGDRTSLLRGHESSVTSIAFSSDGKYIVSSDEDNTLRVWDWKSKTLSEPLPINDLKSVALSTDGRYIATLEKNDGTIEMQIWDSQGNPISKPFSIGSVLSEFSLQFSILDISVAFSPDNRYIAREKSDGKIHMWDLQGNPIGEAFSIGRKEKESDNPYITRSIVFSPDSRYIASASNDGMVRMWDLQGHPIGVFQADSDPTNQINSGAPNPTNQVNAIAFSPDSRYIASGNEDGTVRLWNLQGKLIGIFQKHKLSVVSVAFSPDGQYIVSGGSDFTVRLWNLQGKLIRVFRGHEAPVGSVVFSPDGQFIASGDLKFREESPPAFFQPTVRVWDLQGNPIAIFSDEEGAITSLAFSPDEQYIITRNGYGTVRSHRFGWKALLRVACDRLRDHPVFKTPKSELEKGAKDTCDKYVWSSEGEAYQFLKKTNLPIPNPYNEMEE